MVKRFDLLVQLPQIFLDRRRSVTPILFGEGKRLGGREVHLRQGRHGRTLKSSPRSQLLKAFPQHGHTGFVIAPAAQEAAEPDNPVHRLSQGRVARAVA